MAGLILNDNPASSVVSSNGTSVQQRHQFRKGVFCHVIRDLSQFFDKRFQAFCCNDIPV